MVGSLLFGNTVTAGGKCAASAAAAATTAARDRLDHAGLRPESGFLKEMAIKT
jgi:hypothetical protein